MKSPRFVYIWRYKIDPACRSEFLDAYDSRGEWAQLFSRDPAYLATALLNDAGDENTYVTIDYWRSKAERDAFRKQHADDFASLDAKCEEFTKDEIFLGDYVEVDGERG